MTSIRFNKECYEWNMFGEYWQLVQKYYIAEDTDSYWENCINDFKCFIEKYKTNFSRELAIAFLNNVEKQVLEKRKAISMKGDSVCQRQN